MLKVSCGRVFPIPEPCVCPTTVHFSVAHCRSVIAHYELASPKSKALTYKLPNVAHQSCPALNS